jgi:hypothetical protein
MGMWTSEQEDTFDIVLKQFSRAAYENYESSAFEAGYLQSTLSRMFADLHKRKQKEYLDFMIRATQRQEQEVVQKMNENKTFTRVEA